MSGPVDIAVIVEMLAGRAESLARELLPHGHREGSNWREARRNAGGLGDSLSVCIRGSKAGLWQHAAASRAGDALDLVAYLLFHDSKRDAIAWSRSWLGIDNLDPGRLEQRRRQAEASAKQRARDGEEEEKRIRAAAFRLWLEAEERIAGTPADLYLKGRAIDLARLGAQPRALRYTPRLKHVDDETRAESYWPAMLAAIVNAAGETISVHRTYLEIRADGSVVKAPVRKAKKTLGRFTGGSVRLWRGEWVDAKTGEIKRAPSLGELAARKRPVPADPESALNSIVIAEGIENALTIATRQTHRRVIAAVSLDNMPNVELPPAIRRVYLCADNDEDNKQAAAGLARAIDHFLREKRDVRIVRAPAGYKDVNDLVKGARKESA